MSSAYLRLLICPPEILIPACASSGHGVTHLNHHPWPLALHEQRLHGHRRAERSYSTFKFRKGDLVQGKEQQLHFAGAAMKRYPTFEVRETQVRWWVLWEGIRGQTHWNHNHRKVANLTTWTTALSNSMKLSHAEWGHSRQMGHGGEVWQNVVHWRREWLTTSVFLPWEPHEQYEKASYYAHVNF